MLTKQGRMVFPCHFIWQNSLCTVPEAMQRRHLLNLLSNVSAAQRITATSGLGVLCSSVCAHIRCLPGAPVLLASYSGSQTAACAHCTTFG